VTAHVHAKLMAQYAEDAYEATEPWKRWEVSTSRGCWTGLLTSPHWESSHQYRRKANPPRQCIVSFYTSVPMASFSIGAAWDCNTDVTGAIDPRQMIELTPEVRYALAAVGIEVQP